MLLKKHALLFFLIISAISAKATHNRAGEITYRRIFDANNPNSFTYEATVITYTRLPGNQIPDRCELEIAWGDGISDTIQRVNGSPSNSCPHAGEQVALDIKKNIYKGIHTYSGASCFTISVTDPNRNASVINIPNSTNVAFFIETQLCINPFLGFNNTSPVLLNPPIDNACNCKKFVHNPGAFDSDGDSLSYELISCKDAGGIPIFGYTIPPGVTIDASNGDMIWNCPGPIGEFNFAILIKEWRQGVIIGFVERDLQVTVVGGCANDPPVIAALRDTCVVAGSPIFFNVKASDPNVGDLVTLTSSGGVYQLSSNPANFPKPLTGFTNVSGQFIWNTNCSHVRKQPYQVLFKAEDNDNTTPLVDIKTVNILVIAPAPQNLIATPTGSAIKLNWQQEICSNAIGYHVYRRNSASGYVAGNCITGIPSTTGYIQIATINGLTNTNFIDDNNGNGLINGLDYCYMLYAIFPDGSKSYASDEVCIQLKKDAPIITNVDVVNTHASVGKIYVAWSKPTELDTTTIQGPFRYFIYRSENNSSNFQLLDSTATNLNDTTYIDSLSLNTESSFYFYKIELFTYFPNRTFISNSSKASSVFLSLTPNDNSLQLNWQSTVPWTDSLFIVYRKNFFNPNIFDSIGKTTLKTFTDSGLVNGRTYCYKIRSYGKYSSPGIIYPLVNHSQIACDEPKDLTSPCPPANLRIEANCDLIQNTLQWNAPPLPCGDDVVGYNVYYTPVFGGPYQKIAQINSSQNTSLAHSNDKKSIAGCYAVAALDSFGNEGVLGDSICIDNCPEYELPNVITVDGDGINDFFVPFPYRYVDHIDLSIYNRWGQLVFKSNDPAIRWDGKNTDNQQNVTDGVYFYICDVYEIRLTGLEIRTLKGFLHVFNNQSKKSSN